MHSSGRRKRFEVAAGNRRMTDVSTESNPMSRVLLSFAQIARNTADGSVFKSVCIDRLRRVSRSR